MLSQKHVSFVEKNIESDRAAAAEVQKLSHQNGVPVVVIGKKVIVGFDEDQILKELAKAQQ